MDRFHRLEGTTWLLIGAWAVLTGSFVSRMFAHRLALFDTAVTANVYWRLANGLDDVTALTGVHHLGDHLSITGLVLTPIFTFGTQVGMVVYASLQAASAVMVVFAVGRAAKLAGLGEPTRWVIMCATLLGPGAYLITNFGLREYALGLGPLAMAATDARYSNEQRTSSFWSLIAALTRIEFAASVLLIGLLSWRRGTVARRTALVGGGALVGFTLWFVLNPLGGASTGAHFGHLGASLGEVLVSAVSRPGDVLAPLLEGAWIRGAVGWLLPFGLVLPLAQPRALVPMVPFVALPIFGTWALADAFPEHYWHPILVFAPLAVVALLERKSVSPRLLVPSIGLGVILTWGLFFPWSASWLLPGADRAPSVDALVSVIEERGNDSISAPTPIVHYVLDRPVVYAFPSPFVCDRLSGAQIGPVDAPRLLVVTDATWADFSAEFPAYAETYSLLRREGPFVLYRATEEMGPQPCAEL